ncbi:hypothetical protein PINS_up003755 [Pythium insidiosum]|nr:hypothetical protein PINS_up003755 [Pythium insidiosum]
MKLEKQPAHFQHATSLSRRAQKVDVNTASDGSFLKLGALSSRDVTVLYAFIHTFVTLGPILQVLWVVHVGRNGLYTTEKTADTHSKFQLSKSDALEAAIQCCVLLWSSLFIRHILLFRKRQPIQVVIATIASFGGVVSAVTFAASLMRGYAPMFDEGKRLLSFANALFAGHIFLSLAYLCDYYAAYVLSWTEANNDSLAVLSQRRQRLARTVYAAVLIYVGIRVLLSWRNNIVYDFLPLTNIITPLRIKFELNKTIQPPMALADAVVITIADAALLGIVAYKVEFTQSLFRKVFLRDFTRAYVEFSVFVLYLQRTLFFITIGAYFAAIFAPLDQLFEDSSSSAVVRMDYAGSVRVQLGFRFSFALWLLCVMFSALPVDVVMMEGWQKIWRPARRRTQHGTRLRYFVREADVLMKKAFSDLSLIDRVDPSQFILENHIQAFNFAQLVYARGNKRYAQERGSLMKLIGTAGVTISDLIHDDKTDTHCIIAETETQIIVAFRGTMSSKNAKTDLQASMVLHHVARRSESAADEDKHQTQHTELGSTTRDNPCVHSGFYTAYMSVSSRVLDVVQRLHAADSRKIFLTGHSLGGALQCCARLTLPRS